MEWSRVSGAPASLCTRTQRVAPPERSASTRKAPWVRSEAIDASAQRSETDGKTFTTPSFPCTTMSSIDWAADSGLSRARFLPSRYIVLTVIAQSATTFRSVKKVRKSRAFSGSSMLEYMDEAVA